tara:strand:+ start:1332 stop:1790 length:459 start_codon:yes stop_codon:yes gene_type:complete
MIWRIAGIASGGAAVGILWLTFLGIPLLLPSYLSVRADLEQASADLKAHGVSFDTSETRRDEEGLQCLAAVEAERRYWIAEIERRDARQARFDTAGAVQEPEHDETTLSEPESGLCPGFDFVSARELHGDAGDRPGAAAGPDPDGSPDLRGE